MQSFRSVDAIYKWTQITEAAQREPVTITRHGRPELVVTSVHDYQALLRLKHELLKSDIQAAIEQSVQGQSTTLNSPDKLSAFFDDIKDRGRERLKKAQNHEPG